MKDVKLTSDVFKEEEEGWKSEPSTTILSALEGTDTVRKWQSFMSMLTGQSVQTSTEKKHQQHQVTILIEHGTAKMGLIGCGKTSLNKCQNMLHSKPEVWRPCLQGSRSLKSHKVFLGFLTLESKTSALTKEVGYLSAVITPHPRRIETSATPLKAYNLTLQQLTLRNTWNKGTRLLF